MNEDPASLSRMHEIVPPEPVGWWPPTAGWWLLLVLVLLIAAGAWIRMARRHQSNAYRRAALQQAGELDAAAELVALLKRTALSAWPRDEVASLGGEAWIEWLGRTAGSPVPDAVRPMLLDAPYLDPQRNAPEELRSFVTTWIHTHRR